MPLKKATDIFDNMGKSQKLTVKEVRQKVVHTI